MITKINIRSLVIAFVWLTSCSLSIDADAGMHRASGSLVEHDLVILKSDTLLAISNNPSLLAGTNFRTVLNMQRACFKYMRRTNLDIIYTPENGECTTLSMYTSINPKFRLNGFLDSGHDKLQQQRPQAKEIFMVTPTPLGDVVVCGCEPANNAPVVQVISGASQSVLPSSPIANIRFRATDADADSLSHSFSYTLNAVVSNGLPAGINQSCPASPGLITCNLGGNSPALAGEYIIEISVSDGTDVARATANLTVLQGESIFSNSFEQP